ncbi:MAG TPA: BrnT family toxin, partial [Thermoanaerobaculia bacterium]|nr:BrnT family toxin [Thermoanaerobaculia bacterium]
MKYAWNPAKAASNARRHGITFPEAATVFRDSLAMSYPDPDHSHGEERFI